MVLCRSCYFVVILAFFFFANSLHSIQKIPSSNAREIVYFSLFNYDNLIADFYELDKSYQLSLATYIMLATNLSLEDVIGLVGDENLTKSTRPISYMKSLNKMLISSYNYTILYDY